MASSGEHNYCSEDESPSDKAFAQLLCRIYRFQNGSDYDSKLDYNFPSQLDQIPGFYGPTKKLEDYPSTFDDAESLTSPAWRETPSKEPPSAFVSPSKEHESVSLDACVGKEDAKEEVPVLRSS